MASCAPTCPHCGAELDPPDSLICINCGFYLAARPAPSSGGDGADPDADGPTAAPPGDHQ